MRLTDRALFLLITGCGLGLAPVASGTFGTLGGIAVAVVLQIIWTANDLAIALTVATAVLLAIGCSLSKFTERTFPRKDPGAFVLDEIVGYLAALAVYSSLHGDPTVIVHVVCFFVFRFFDIAKVFPANRLELIPGAPGIMLDDVMAGLYTGAVLTLLVRFVGL